MSQEVLVLTIDNHEYKIKLGDQNPEHIQKLATYIDEKISEFKENFPNLAYHKLLIIVSLNIADELHRYKSIMDDNSLEEQEIKDALSSIQRLILSEEEI